NLKRLRELECIRIPSLEGTSGICFPSTLEKLHLLPRRSADFSQTNLKSLERLTKLSISSEWSILEELPRNLEFLYLEEPTKHHRPTKESDTNKPIRLENLRELRLDGFGKMDGVYCPKLERLSFDSDYRCTNLKEACPNLKVLNLLFCGPDYLHNLPNLHTFTSTRGSIRNPDGNYNLPTSLEVLKLCQFDFDDENIKQLNLTELTKLKKLDISRNRLTKLTSDLFPSSLTELNASWNRFSEIDLKNLESLQKLNISQAKFESISDWRISLPNLESLFMVESYGDVLPDITRAIDNCDHLKYAFLGDVKIMDTPTLIKSKCKDKIGHVVSVGGKII
ncbi:hypothetical protein G210_5679, partial [Candida maltosa Xu316]